MPSSKIRFSSVPPPATLYPVLAVASDTPGNILICENRSELLNESILEGAASVKSSLLLCCCTCTAFI